MVFSLCPSCVFLRMVKINKLVSTTHALAFQSDRVSSVYPIRQQVMASRIRLSVLCL